MTKNMPALIDGRPLSTTGVWIGMSASDRLEAVKNIKIFGPEAARCLTRLDERLRGGGPASSGNSGLLITGPDRIGKHALVQHLARSNPPVPTDTIDAHSIIVVPPVARPDPGALTEAIELATRWRYRERLFAGAGPAFQVNRICEALHTRVLVFDRAMFLCTSFGVAAEAVPFLVGIMDAGQVLVVLVGSNELRMRIRKTRDLAGKFFTWPLKPFEYDETWIRALGEYEIEMPFEKGSLTANTMPARLYLACWGKMPRFAQLTVEAARNRLRNRKSNGTLKMEDFQRAHAELEPGSKNPFDPKYEGAILVEDIARGLQATASDLTEID
jgi:Bacterial TniB protein